MSSFNEQGSCIPHGRYNCGLCRSHDEARADASRAARADELRASERPTWDLAAALYVQLQLKGPDSRMPQAEYLRSSDLARLAIGRARIFVSVWESMS